MNLEDQVVAIAQTLETMRPYLQQDGGDLTFLKFENGIVYVQLHGACSFCPISMITLKHGVEERLKQECSFVTEVISV